jgi:electron transport complex protein RnfE
VNQTLRQFKNGMIEQNPITVLLLGLCPVLATSSTVENAVGMGLATMAVLICSNTVIAALRKLIPEKIRFAAFVVIIAGFVTSADFLLQAFIPSVSESLGIFVPLIVVNCIVFARAETYAFRSGVVRSAIDGLSVGMGFMLAIMAVAAIRELLSAGTLYGFRALPETFPAFQIIAKPPGGFLVLGLVLAAVQFIRRRKKARGPV